MSESEGMKCPITGCPVKKVLITTVVVFVVTYAFDWIFHGKLLMADYEATANLWRPMEDMQAMWGVCLFYHAVLSLGVAGLYCLLGKKSGCGGACPVMGIRFGLLLGTVLGISSFSAYLWMPMPMELAIKWLGGSIAWGVITGYILSLVCGKCGSCNGGSCEAKK